MVHKHRNSFVSVCAALLLSGLLIAQDVSQGPYGGSGGSAFNKLMPAGARITSVQVQAGRSVDNMSFVHCMGQSGSFGTGSGGSARHFSLASNAYLKWVDVWWSPSGSVDGVQLIPSFGRSVSAGTTTGGTSIRMGRQGYEIAGFHGRAGGLIDALGVWLRPLPVIKHPSSKTVCLGYQSTAPTFSVTATGATNYQWQKNRVNMAGKTSSILTLSTNITAADAGLYRCVISLLCYSVTSNEGRLTVSANCRSGRITPVQVGPNFASALTRLGDFNGDGYQDFAIGHQGATAGGRPNAGCIHIYSGKDQSSLNPNGWCGAQPFQLLGGSLAAGDLDQDGRKDLIAGATGVNTNAGGIYWVSSTGGGLRTFKIGAPGEQLGWRVGSAQYLDQDGVWDVLASADSRLYAYSGRTGAQLWTQVCSSRIFAIANLGDLNGDGYDDVGVGCPLSNISKGRIEIRSGKNGALLRARDGQSAVEKLGYSISSLGGDLDGDRIPDYISCSPELSSKRGVMSWWSGATGAFLGNTFGTTNDHRFGFSVSGCGDYNGDGKPDALATAYPASTLIKGYAQIISGADTTTVLRTFGGESSDFGFAAVAMDTNGDSRMDAIVSEFGKQVLVYDAPPKANPPSQLTFGAICPDSAGRLPRASHSPDPRINSTGYLSMDSGPRSSVTILHVGLKRLPPMNLQAINMPGCWWHVLPMVQLGGIPTDSLGRVRMPLTIPNNITLIGSKVSFQWTPVDLGLGNTVLQVVASNGYEVKIGAIK